MLLVAVKRDSRKNQQLWTEYASALLGSTKTRFFLLARLADTIHLKVVARGHVVVFASNLFLYLVDLRRIELHRAPALRANHMMMAATVVLMLVAGHAVLEGHLARQSALRQQLQRPVDRGEPDPRIVALHQMVQFLRREMATCLQKRAQDCVALSGVLQPDSFQVVTKTLLGLPYRFMRELRTVINVFRLGGGHKQFVDERSIPSDTPRALIF